MDKLIIFLLLLLAGCTNLPEYKWYKYHLDITTGLAESIEYDDKRIAIKFSELSDNVHLYSFMRLNQDIVLSGNEISVYGKLLPKIHHTPSGETQTEEGEIVVYPTSEPFQYFQLINWSIKLPFKLSRLHYDENDNLEIITENKLGLTKDDFVGAIYTNPKIYEAQ
jgi:hypothetical protein